MPKPLYIICAESGAQDKATGRVSHFNVVEKIILSEAAPATLPDVVPVLPLPLQIVAVWVGADEDKEREFEYEFVFRFSSEDAEDRTVGRGTFKFGRRLHRFTMNVPGVFFGKAGIFTIISRIRPTGENDWLCQEYPIEVEPTTALKE